MFGLGYPAVVFSVLRWNKDLIKEDQLLRASGFGDSRVENPNAYEIRKRYHKLYYHFKPGKTYWILLVIGRKFGIAVASLVFADNPSFQLSTVLLVLFVAYVLQVQHRPFMSTAERESVLRHHKAKMESGDREEAQKHLELEERLKEIERRIKRERRLKKQGAMALEKVSAAKQYFWDFNTVEQTLLACAILVCVAGIMFESPRFEERDDLEWQKDVLTYGVMIVIAFSIFYYLAIFISEALTALGIGQRTIARFTGLFMSKKYKANQENLDDNLDKMGGTVQENPMFKSDDQEKAELRAEVEMERARQLRQELEAMKDANEKLVSEVNDAKKREAAANLSHFASTSPSSGGSGMKRTKKHKKKKFTEPRPMKEVELGDMPPRGMSIMDRVGLSKEARRAPSKEDKGIPGHDGIDDTVTPGEFNL